MLLAFIGLSILLFIAGLILFFSLGRKYDDDGYTRVPNQPWYGITISAMVLGVLGTLGGIGWGIATSDTDSFT